MSNFWSGLQRPIRVLAPMEDVTDMVFRKIVASCGTPDVQVTEFTSAEILNSARPERALQRLVFDPAELAIPTVAQIWGSSPEAFYRAAQRIAAMGFHGIDLNMGCPVKKITRRGGCSALIAHPDLARELLFATREGAPELPVSIKTRLGIKTQITEEWCGFLLEQKLPVLTVHGRIAAQQSEGEADWAEINRVVKLRDQVAPDTLILGNGDVFSRELIDSRIRESGADGVMIGRGIFRDLAIFAHDAPHLPFPDFPISAKLDILARHVRDYRDAWGKTKNFETLKRFFKIYTVNFEGELELRDRLMRIHSYDDALTTLAQWRAERSLS